MLGIGMELIHTSWVGSLSNWHRYGTYTYWVYWGTYTYWVGSLSDLQPGTQSDMVPIGFAKPIAHSVVCTQWWQLHLKLGRNCTVQLGVHSGELVSAQVLSTRIRPDASLGQRSLNLQAANDGRSTSRVIQFEHDVLIKSTAAKNTFLPLTDSAKDTRSKLVLEPSAAQHTTNTSPHLLGSVEGLQGVTQHLTPFRECLLHLYICTAAPNPPSERGYASIHMLMLGPSLTRTRITQPATRSRSNSSSVTKACYSGRL